jgi:hypothetical protein
VRDDQTLPLRLYATYRATEAADEQVEAVRTRLRERDERLNRDWTEAIEKLPTSSTCNRARTSSSRSSRSS